MKLTPETPWLILTPEEAEPENVLSVEPTESRNLQFVEPQSSQPRKRHVQKSSDAYEDFVRMETGRAKKHIQLK